MALLYLSDHLPGIVRERTPSGFRYRGPDGKILSDEGQLERIKKLVIPPMWEDVWISPHPHGYVQATGRDSKGRKQYIYHAAYRNQQQLSKFSNLFQFGSCLTAIRARLQQDIRRRRWDKYKMLAIVLELLDEHYLRIGNNCYHEENGTFGATTLRKKHLHMEKEGMVLQYKAKAGKLRKINLRSGQLARLVRKCSELPGYELFRYAENGKFHTLESADVNEYLREITGQDFTSKTFRTWGGTVMTLEKIPDALVELEQFPKRKFEAVLVKHVSQELGNTQSVCRNYYMHPQVLQFAIGHAAGSHPSKHLRPLSRKVPVGLLHDSEKLVMRIIQPA